MKKINNFREQHAFLSNFYKCDVFYEGMIYPSAETAFQAAKCADIKDRLRFEFSNPSEAKTLGRRIKLRADWEIVKVDVMREIIKEKFINNPELSVSLQQTGQAELIEENLWHDNFWGDCVCQLCKNINGRNIFGKLLMELREQINYTKKEELFMVDKRYYNILFSASVNSEEFEIHVYVPAGLTQIQVNDWKNELKKIENKYGEKHNGDFYYFEIEKALFLSAQKLNIKYTKPKIDYTVFIKIN